MTGTWRREGKLAGFVTQDLIMLRSFEKEDAARFREALAVGCGRFGAAIIAGLHRLALDNEVTLKNEDLFHPAVPMRGKLRTSLHSNYRSDRFLSIIDKEDFILATRYIYVSPLHSFRSGNE
jgi:hypothetical protein